MNTDFTLNNCLFGSVKLGIVIQINTNTAATSLDLVLAHYFYLQIEAWEKMELLFVLSLHYNRSKRFLFVKAAKIYQFKAKNSEIKDYAPCLSNISKDFINDLKRAGLKGVAIFFLLILILLIITIF